MSSMEEGLKVKELNAIKKLFNLRFCDEDDIEDLLQLIYSSYEEYKGVYTLEKLEEDFSSENIQWCVLETNGAEECLLLAARFRREGDEIPTINIFSEKSLDILTTKSRIINYFLLQLQTISHNMEYSDVVIEIPATVDPIFLQLLEEYEFFDNGGYLVGSSLMMVQYKKRLASSIVPETQIAEDQKRADEGIEVEFGFDEGSSTMKDLIGELFAALHKSPEFKTDSDS